MTRRQPPKAAMTRTMKAIARKRTCSHCLKQNALGRVKIERDGMRWRTCRLCGTKVWAGE